MSGYADFAAVYDELNADFPYEQVAAYYHQLITKFGAPGKLLLDLGCGTGTLSFALEKLGYDVIGIDASEQMLSCAMEKKMQLADAGTPSQVQFLEQTMQELDMFGTMDVTVSCLDCINHLPDEAAVKQAFERVSLFTIPGGLFLFDCNTVYKHQKVLENNTFVYDTGSVYCVWQNTLLPENTVQMDLDLFLQDEDPFYERAQESFCERAYPQETITRLLVQAGFVVEAVYDGFGLNPPHERSERLVFCCRKPTE